MRPDRKVNLAIRLSGAQTNIKLAKDIDHNRACCSGILLSKLDFLTQWIGRGFAFLAVGSIGGCVAGGLKSIAAACRQ